MEQYQPQYPLPEFPTMTFGEAVKTCFNKYADFTGRATRGEYWWWYVFTVLFSACCEIISPTLGALCSVVLILPSLAVAWRRLHDIGKGGGWWFIWLIPLVGIIILLIYLCRRSELSDNRFGPFPWNNWQQEL
jgi:uncharacterized membrane protein YhaH (DUF805 family)